MKKIIGVFLIVISSLSALNWLQTDHTNKAGAPQPPAYYLGGIMGFMIICGIGIYLIRSADRKKSKNNADR